MDVKGDMKKAALEFMISVSEAKSATVRKVNGWTAAIITECLEGMGELADDNLHVWLQDDVHISDFCRELLFIVDDYSLPSRTQRTTRTRTGMSSQSIGPLHFGVPGRTATCVPI